MKLSRRLGLVLFSLSLLAVLPTFSVAQSSKRILANIHEQLAQPENNLQAHSVNFQYFRGTITIDGVVSSEADRGKIERIVQNSAGVKGVTNNLSVTSPGKVGSGVVWDIKQDLKKVRGEYEVRVVSGKDGVVQLAGFAINEKVKKQIEEIAERHAREKGVNSMLVVGRHISNEELESQIRTALIQELGLLNSKVDIQAEQGVVTLSGVRKSQRDIDQVLTIVTMIDGVVDVKSLLTTE